MRHFVTWPRTGTGSALRWADRGGDIVLAATGSHPVVEMVLEEILVMLGGAVVDLEMEVILVVMTL